MADGHDEHGASGVLQSVDDPVVTGTNAPEPVGTLNRHGTVWPRGPGKPVDRPRDRAAGRLTGNLLKCPFGRGLQTDSVSGEGVHTVPA